MGKRTFCNRLQLSSALFVMLSLITWKMSELKSNLKVLLNKL